MKIEGYQGGNVNLNTVSATVKRVGDAMAYGGDGSGLRAVGQAANQWAAVIQKQQDEEDRQAILQAMDAYNKGRYNIMYNDDNGLMNTVAEGSTGISQSYIDQEKELRDGVMKSVKLHSRRNAVALENLMNKSAQQGFQQVDQHQYRQGEAVKDLRLNNNLLNEIEYVQKNPLSIQDSFDRYALMVGARYSGMKGGPELTEAKVREAQSQIVGAAIGAAMQQGDMATAQQITSVYGHFLTSQQRSSYGAAIQKNVEIKEQMSAAQRLYDQYGDDMAAVRSAIDSMNFSGAEPQAEGTTWVKNSGVSLEGVQDNTRKGLNYIAKTFSDMGGGQLIVTSGTDSTDIHAAGQRSHGGGWKLDVAADWLENEDNRKAYIKALEAKGIRVLDEYSNPSPNSTGGHLDLDFTDYTGGSMDSLQAYKKREGVWEAYTNKVSAAQRMEKLQLYKLGNDFSKEVYQWLQNGNVSYDQALAEALKRAGGDRKALGVYVDAVNDWYKAYGQSGTATGGSRNSRTSSEASLQIKKAQYMLSNGQFNSADEYVGWISNISGVSGKDIWDARQEFSEWYEHKGKYKFDLDADFKNTVLGNLKESERNRLWPGVKLYMYQAISDFMIANKREPSRVEVEAMGQQALTQNKIGTYNSHGIQSVWNFPDLNLSPAELARMNIRDIKNVSTTDNGDFYQVFFTDGRPPQYMFGEQIKKMNEGIVPNTVIDYGLPEGE